MACQSGFARRPLGFLANIEWIRDAESDDAFSPLMDLVRNSFFDRWAASRLGISGGAPSLADLERLETPADLPEGPDSELGGETQSVLDHPTESELRDLAQLGDEILAELPPLPAGYQPPQQESETTTDQRCTR